MAIYILDGGGIRTSKDQGKRLFSELIRGIDNPKILLSFFAQPEEGEFVVV